MRENSQKNKFSYFAYFKSIVGWHIYSYAVLNFFVGLLDGLGLAMFIPLLSIASGAGTERDVESLGKLKVVLDYFSSIGLELNLVNALVIMVLLFALKAIVSYIRQIYFSKIRLSSISKQRIKLISGLQKLSYSGFTKMEMGKIQNTMIGELGKLIGALTAYFSVIQNLVMLLTYVVMAFLSNWQFAILVAIGGAVSNFLYKFLNNYTLRKARELSSKSHDFNEYLVQALHNYKYLKATNYFSRYSGKLKNNIEEQESLNFRMNRVGAIAENAREPMIILIIAIVIVIQTAYFNSPFATILVSLLLFYRSLAHLVALQNVWNTFLANVSGVESFETLLKTFKADEEPQNLTDVIDEINDIEVQNINIAFDDRKVLDNINLSIKKNTSVALVGESGAGKTTLANIICGLQIPDSGKIMVDGKSLYESQINSFRKRIGYITQEAVIFNDTLYNNVSFWEEKNEENYSKFKSTMHKVALESFVEKLPKKEDSKLGNNGILISGGQKQRVSIARELYKDIDLLIMDEATSALDSETERHIKNNIDLLQGQTTLIIIAHRLSTIKDVDVIYLLEDGEISAYGNFTELCEKSEKFRKMVELQEVQY